MKQEHINEIIGIMVFALGLILLASYVSYAPNDLPWYTSHPNIPVKNWVGIVGAYIAGVCFFIFGSSSYFLVIFLFFWSWNKFACRDLVFTFSKFVSFFVLFSVISAFFSLLGPAEDGLRFQRAGIIGFSCADFLVKYLDRTGAFIILTALGILTLIFTGEFLVSPLIVRFMEWSQGMTRTAQEKWIERKELVASTRATAISSLDRLSDKKHPFRFAGVKDEGDRQEKKQEPDDSNEEGESLINKNKDKTSTSKKPNIRITKPTQPAGQEKVETKVVGEYRLPPLDLLELLPQESTSKIESDLALGAQTLETTLADFNVNVRVADIERGPVITRYELEPAPGVKVQQITTLADDIALSMKAAAVRIVAPIPGKNRVGIEVPNGSKAAVYLRDVLSQSRFQGSKSKLMLAIGKDISGRPMIADLAEMPHLLIAGTTGAGKTVCVNCLIMSMLYNASPQEVKFLMVDPKMVELTQYNDLPHMLCPAVTDPKKVSAALNWVVSEMENRYQQLSKAGVRNIKAYHAKGQQMPYIVVIVDELADLMQTSAKSIESAIMRLAQLSRAVGIHLILATQRPSVNVITGVIKANFPARISFKVASKVDSRTVLDMNGAETLLGKGDLLFMQPGDAKPTRGQCSFVSDGEVHRVMDFIKSQQTPDYNDTIIKHQKSGGTADGEQKDELYDEALRMVMESNQASVSILQRRMRLGYTRAARLIDMMEQAGIVGPYCGSKPRDILIDREEWLLNHMNNQNQGQ
jgi:S-DNA-T family DNA segregation ATPase FtsK/SpoIIIE